MGQDRLQRKVGTGAQNDGAAQQEHDRNGLADPGPAVGFVMNHPIPQKENAAPNPRGSAEKKTPGRGISSKVYPKGRAAAPGKAVQA